MGQVIPLPETFSGRHVEPAFLGRTELFYRESAATYRSIVNAICESVLIYTWEGRLVEANDAALRLLGFSRQKLLGRSARHLASPKRNDLPKLFRALRLTMTGLPQQLEFWARHANGHSLPLQLQLSQCDFYGMPAVLVIARDIREQHSHFDPLTRLPNRILLGERLRQALQLAHQTSQRLAIAYLDLDGFKPINDRHGHDVGDQVLVEVAQRLAQLIGENGTVARIGGDEFVCILPQEAGIAPEPQLELLLEAVASPYACVSAQMSISASLGVTFFPDDDSSADALLRHADQAMYIAKRTGTNRIAYFDVDAARRESELQQTRRRIQTGLQHDEFRLYYQPKVNMRSGSIIGLEALIRWQHPERGLLTPGLFLPAAEDCDLIVEIGIWTLEAALAQIQEWWLQGLNLNVSVNLSARQLHRPDFVSKLTQLLGRYPNLAPGQLELEILETTALENTGRVRQVIDACAKLGVRFSLDDFGTGYSSLAYLKSLPATTLKIDQCFIREILDEPGEVAIAEGIISLAHAFHQEVIAEGVESIAHGQLLLQLGCDLAQGYGIARPMPAEEVAGWVAAWQPPPLWQELASWQWAHEDHPLIAIAVEHRHWVRGILEALEAGEPLGDESLFDPGLTRLGCWYEGRGFSLYGRLPAFADIEVPLHRIHVTVQRIATLLTNGKQDEARQLKTLLEGEHDQVLAALWQLQLQVARVI